MGCASHSGAARPCSSRGCRWMNSAGVARRATVRCVAWAIQCGALEVLEPIGAGQCQLHRGPASPCRPIAALHQRRQCDRPDRRRHFSPDAPQRSGYTGPCDAGNSGVRCGTLRRPMAGPWPQRRCRAHPGRFRRPIAPKESLLAGAGEGHSHGGAHRRAITPNRGGTPQWADDSTPEPAVYIT